MQSGTLPDISAAMEGSCTISRRSPGRTIHDWMCRACRKLESPEHSLLRCEGCEHTFYCDTTCQSDDYKLHNNFCRTIAAERRLSEDCLLTDNTYKVNNREFYKLDCENCQGSLYCGSRMQKACKKRDTWKTITENSDANFRTAKKKIAALSRAVAVGHGIANTKNDIQWLSKFMARNKERFSREQTWLLETLYCMAYLATEHQVSFFPDVHVKANHPPQKIQTKLLQRYMSPSDNKKEVKISANVSNCILHTAAQTMNLSYGPTENTRQMMELARFLLKISNLSDVQFAEDKSEFVMQPKDVYIIYEAKKRARYVLGEPVPVD